MARLGVVSNLIRRGRECRRVGEGGAPGLAVGADAKEFRVWQCRRIPRWLNFTRAARSGASCRGFRGGGGGRGGCGHRERLGLEAVGPRPFRPAGDRLYCRQRIRNKTAYHTHKEHGRRGIGDGAAERPGLAYDVGSEKGTYRVVGLVVGGGMVTSETTPLGEEMSKELRSSFRKFPEVTESESRGMSH